MSYLIHLDHLIFMSRSRKTISISIKSVVGWNNCRTPEYSFELNMQKQPSRGVLVKRYSGNMHQIYRRTPISKCDFNKAAVQLY